MDCQETWELVTDLYSVWNNIVLRFKRDEIDQSPRFAETLFNRFGRDGKLEYSRQVCPPTRVGVRRDCGEGWQGIMQQVWWPFMLKICSQMTL